MLTVIKNGLVYDGTGSEPVRKDVLISGNKIIGLGIYAHRRTDRVIDATGGVVTPGFIDINGDLHHGLDLSSPDWTSHFLRSGVTTVVLGSRGLALFPVFREETSRFIDGGLSGRQNPRLASAEEFIKYLKKSRSQVNVGFLLGYQTLRQNLVRGENRDLSDPELAWIKEFVKKTLRAGVLGVSLDFGLPPNHPLAFNEFAELARLLSSLKKVLAVHLLADDVDILPMVEKLVHLGKTTGVSLEINHFNPNEEHKGVFQKAKWLIEQTAGEAHIHFDICPSRYSLKSLISFLPEFARSIPGEELKMSILRSQFQKDVENYLIRFDPEKLTVIRAPRFLRFWEGKTIADFGLAHDLRPAHALLKFLVLTRLDGLLMQENIDPTLIKDFLDSSQSLLASNFANSEYEPFPALLKNTAFTHSFPLEKIIYKSTQAVGVKYRLDKRGVIKEHYFADLTVFNETNFTVKHVLVNGRPVLEDGQITKDRSGSLLR